MRLRDTPLIASDAIQRRVRALAQQISQDYAVRELALVAVLKGSLFFAADLARCLCVPVTMDFIHARSYAGTESRGEVEFAYVPQNPLRDKHVLVIEDILDTGRTAAAVLDRLRKERPASLALCSLIDKPARRETQTAATYIGFTIDNHFVVGYGLDYEEHGRELPDIHVLLDE